MSINVPYENSTSGGNARDEIVRKHLCLSIVGYRPSGKE